MPWLPWEMKMPWPFWKDEMETYKYAANMAAQKYLIESYDDEFLGAITLQHLAWSPPEPSIRPAPHRDYPISCKPPRGIMKN